MPNYRRWRRAGGIVFLTVVTCERQTLFDDPVARRLLRLAMETVRLNYPWQTEAMVLLPNHWHALWRLPQGDDNYSVRVSRIKKLFTHSWLARGGKEMRVSSGKRRARRRGVWQVKFWEHIIRDAADFKRHLDYIHINPVKHGYVERVADWEWSSFQRWVGLGEYEQDWLGRVDLPGNVEYFWHD